MSKSINSAAVTVIAIAVLCSVFASPAAGQCLPARLFASAGTGPGDDNVRFDPGSAENAGNEIGRFWQSSNSYLGNNFGGDCPSQNGEAGWWLSNAAGLRRIEGYNNSSYSDGTICQTQSCPNGDLTLVVEERSAAGDDALFIGLRVDATPPDHRWWDFSRVDPSASPSVLPLLPFPGITVLSSSVLPGDEVQLDLSFQDVAPNVHAVNGPGDDPLPASSVVRSFDLYRNEGPGDPGRDVADWTLIASIPYEDGPGSTTIAFPCSDETRLALGLSFQGGDGPHVVSSFVGKVLEVECGLETVSADAGDDRTAECSGPEGTPVTLDGSGTEGAIEVEWLADGIVFDDPHSLMPTGLFPTGMTEVLLIATADPYVDTDSVLVTVHDDTEPDVTCGINAVGGGYDDEGDDSVRLSIAVTAEDVCCGETPAAADIDLGWASLPVVDGQVIELQCESSDDDEGDDCSGVNDCAGHLRIRSGAATLRGIATDCNGNVATCELDLCRSANRGSANTVESAPRGDLGRRTVGPRIP